MKVTYPLRFFVYPNPKNEYYAMRVHLFKVHGNVVRMFRNNRRYAKSKCNPMAFFERCDGATHLKSGTYDPGFCGQLVFSRDNLDMGTVAHECLHAGVHYCDLIDRAKLRTRDHRQDNKNEELLAGVVDSLVNQIVNKLIEYKL